MIVRDEEEVLERCLESIEDLVDEIIIVDTGSVDKTKEIAECHKAKVYDFKWVDDFAAARNFSFSKATMDYILWLDADDVLLEIDRERFQNVKNLLHKGIDVVMMKYNLGTDDKGNPKVSFFRERILKRENNYIWYNPVHEYIKISGNIVNCEVCITHKKEHSSGMRNLKIFEKILERDNQLNNRNCFYYARELFFNGMYDKAIIYYEKFLETEDGTISNYIDTCIDLSKCYKLKKKDKVALRTLMRSFEFDLPRAEICCMIGYHFKELEQFDKAIYWFELINNLKKPNKNWGFIIPDCWDFVPNAELAIIYYKLGNVEKAYDYNERAIQAKPDNTTVLKNKVTMKAELEKLTTKV
jgi:glycosyltransferase involved in cell wall biosynthesis